MRMENDIMVDWKTAFQNLQQEIEQLKVQNAAMREVLKELENYPTEISDNRDCAYCGKGEGQEHYEFCKLNKVLSTDAADYHNPADVDALKQARESIKFFSNHYLGAAGDYLDHKKSPANYR